MHCGLIVPNVGMFGDARMLADLAHEAEEAGWDGFFLWDTIHYLADNSERVCDPWIALAAIAMRTERVRIGPWRGGLEDIHRRIKQGPTRIA